MSVTPRTTCRVSGEPLVPLFTLGNLFISDFIPPDEVKKGADAKVELKMMLAPESGLVQLAHTAPSDDMYRRYWYRSGTNATMKKELQAIAERATELMRPTASDVWVDIGCNDGTLLSFVPKEVTRVGFDPANNTFVEAESRKHANEIVVDYFTQENYKKTVSGATGKKAKVVTSIAMFYDLEDPNAFVDDVKNVMDDEGLWIIQMSYLPLMLEQLAFDNICHEHLEYYSLESLKFLLDRHGMTIVDCEMNDVNGGSYRIYIRKNNATPQKFATAPYRDVANMRVAQMLAYEATLNLKDPKTYENFFKKIEKLRDETVAFIKAEKAKGKTVWGYGASTKGNTLLQWYGLDKSLIDGIAERMEIKYGHTTVGTEIPIVSEADMRRAKPDYLLVLPWHFIYEFQQREQDYLKSGGKFILPCPRFEVIGA
jgi:hypothetical protein